MESTSSPSLPESEPAPRKGASKTARVVAGTVAVALLVALGAGIAVRMGDVQQANAGHEAERAASANAAAELPRVFVVTPVAATHRARVEVTGTLEPAQSADIGFEAGGRLLSIGVALGDHVQQGDLLGVLDRSAASAQTAQSDAAIGIARAQVDMARDRLSRVERLTRTGAAAEAERLTAEQQLRVTEAQLAQAVAVRRASGTQTAAHTARAPFAGVVTRVPSGLGSVVAPGAPLFRVEDLASLRLRSSLGEHEIALVRSGQRVELEGTGVSGEVATVIRSLDPVTRRAPIEVRIDNANGALVGNSLVHASIVGDEEHPSFRIPGTALRLGTTVLLVGEGDTIEERAVNAIVEPNGTALVLSGLAASARVVTHPSGELTSGVRVRPEVEAAAPREPTKTPPRSAP